MKLVLNDESVEPVDSYDLIDPEICGSHIYYPENRAIFYNELPRRSVCDVEIKIVNSAKMGM